MTWFIDGGAHRGESIRFARGIYGADLHVVAVEPNVDCLGDLEAERALVVPAALASPSGLASLWIDEREASASTVREKFATRPAVERVVPGVTLTSILRALPPWDRVIVKLDIEGAEYDVLEQTLEANALAAVAELHVDFHADRIPSIGRDRHNALVERLLGAGYALPKWMPVEGQILPKGRGWLL